MFWWQNVDVVMSSPETIIKKTTIFSENVFTENIKQKTETNIPKLGLRCRCINIIMLLFVKKTKEHTSGTSGEPKSRIVVGEESNIHCTSRTVCSSLGPKVGQGTAPSGNMK